MLKKSALISFILSYIIITIFWINYAKAINISKKCNITESNNSIELIKQNVREMETMANLGKESVSSREKYLDNLHELIKDRAWLRKFPFILPRATKKAVLVIDKRINNTFDFNVEYYEQLYNNTEKINCSINCIEETLNDLQKEIDDKTKQNVEFNNNLSSIKEIYNELENKKIPKAQEELNNVTKNIELKKQEKLELDNEVSSAISQLNEIKYSYDKLVNDINDKNKTYNELTNNITRTNETYNTILNENIPEAQNKLLNITRDYEIKVEQMNNLANISDKLNFEINKNKEEFDNITKSIDLKKQEKLELDNEVSGTTSLLNETKYSYDKLINDINDKNKTYNELIDNITKTNETYNTILNNNIPEAQKEFNNIVENVELKKQEELELVNRISNLKSELNSANIVYTDIIDKQMPEIQQQLDNATIVYSNKLEQLNILDIQIENKNKILDEIKYKYNSDEALEVEKLNEIKRSIKDKKEEKEKVDNEYKIIKEEVERLKKERTKLKNEIDNNKIKNDILKKDIIENEEKLLNITAIDSDQDNNIFDNMVDKNLEKEQDDEINQQNYNPNEINKSNERSSVFDDVINDANKILYTLNKNLNLSLFNEIDSDNLLYNNKDIDNFKFNLNTEKVNRINSLNFKGDIVRFTVKKNIEFCNFSNFGFVLSYNDIYTKANKSMSDNRIVNSSLDSKSISTGVYFKYFIVENKKRNLFNNVKLIYTFAKNRQNYFVNNYNFGKFESNQVALQTGLGTDFLLNNFFRLSPKIDLNAIFLKIGKRNLNIEDIEQKFGTKGYNFISLTPAIFFTTSQFYIKDNIRINFGTNLFYNIALSKTNIIIDNKEQNMDKNIFGLGLAVNLLMFNNVNFGFNYNLFKTKGANVDNGFGVGLNCNF